MNEEFIKNEIERKSIQNKKFGKKYKIDFTNKQVFKYKEKSDCLFENDCAKLLSEYYNSIGLNFSIKNIDDYLVLVSPFVTTACELGITSDLKLINKTMEILNNNKNKFLENLIKDGFFVKIFCDNFNSKNFFVYNNEYYLLDLEGFYFCIYDKNNNSVGRKGIREEYLNVVKDYNLNEIDEKTIVNDNMLVY